MQQKIYKYSEYIRIKIINYRKHLNMSQDEFADFIMIPRKLYKFIELDLVPISPLIIIKFIGVLNVDIVDLNKEFDSQK